MDPLSEYLIQKFFKSSTIPREACDDEATAIGSGQVAKPTSTQGSESYTVRVGDGTNGFIVQFRDPKYPLDDNLLVAARETYGQFVPVCHHLKGLLNPLHVYTMNDVSGESLLLARHSLHHPENFRLLTQTVQDFAVFSASAWYNQPISLPSFNSTSIQNDYSSRLERISKDLPDDFRPLLDKLKSQLPSLFTNGYPMVINHWDLLENNIHVDVQTGYITGIVDWRNARVGPFATQLWGLENILGIRKTTCMGFHPQHIELRRLFWRKFYEEIGDVSKDVRDAIQTARMVGIFLANGDITNFAAEERDMDLAVLESMTLKLSDIGLITGM